MVRPPPQNASTSNLSTNAGAGSSSVGPEGQPQAFSSDAAFDSTIGSTNPTFNANTFGGHSSAMVGSTQVSHISNPVNSNSQENPSDIRSSPRSPFSFPNNPGYGMPTTLMANLFSNQHLENPPRFSPSISGVGNSGSRPVTQALSSSFVMSLRQQMDESNHEMVNTLTSQLGTVLNPLINNTNDSYQLLAGQMSRIADFFGAPLVPNQPFRPVQNQIPIQHQGMPEGSRYNVSQSNPPVTVREEVQRFRACIRKYEIVRARV
ncbi:hypothetical protein L195_g047984 [Trifolium pratense]|uniref:Uncharacterized protein n=1 Tax=Trifolium pratense TaxID=57577 RepID=A0A2K3JK04_TRIPR|nr:hypothetical protein L195_g047984 [Trifolium pratense]